jgi:hypothetical protein
MSDRPAWHALFAPLPPDAVPTRQPVAPPEILATPAGASVAGWEQVVVHLSDPCTGLRTVLVVVDASGSPISAGDSVFDRIDGDPPRVRHESVGGRFEADGTFRGTHWLSVGPDRGDDEPAQLESTPRAPTPDEIAAMRALVEEVLRRQPRRS